MSKFTYSLLATVLFSGSVVAQQKFETDRESFRNSHEKITGSVVINGHEVTVGKITVPATREGESVTPDVTPIITNPPGEVRLYTKDCGGTIYSWLYGGVNIYESSYPAQLVWDGDDVYIPEILNNGPYYSDSYIKGTLQGSDIVVPLPQTVVWYDEGLEEGITPYGYNITLLKLYEYADDRGNPQFTYVYDESISSMTYSMAEDGSFSMALPGGFDGENLPEYVLGLVFADSDPEFNNSWTGFCDMYQFYTPFNEVQTSLPEGLDMEPYSVIMDDYGFPAEVAFDGNTVYFVGLSQNMPEAVIIGYVDEGADFTKETIVRIPQNEYLGIFRDATYAFTKVAYLNPDFDPNDGESLYMLLAPDDMAFELVYNSENKTFVPKDTNYYFCVNAVKDRVSAIDIYDTFTVAPRTSYAGVPQNPYNLIFDAETAQYYGYATFFFTIPCLSTEGTLLDSDCVYYSVYINDNKMTFEESYGRDLAGYDTYMYYGVTEPTDMLPLSFENGFDIYKYYGYYTSVQIGLYVEGMDTVGVQTVYTYGDEITTSDIMTLDVSDAGVSPVAGAEEISSEWYTLQGVKVNNPDNGILVKRSVLSDGTVISRKVVR